MSKRKKDRYWGKEFIETELKHRVLEKYLPTYWRILGRKAQGFTYIDGFAGAGKYSDGSKGSPLLAMELVSRLRSDGSLAVPVHFCFIEADIEKAKQLEQAAIPLAKELALEMPIVIHGPFQEHILPLLATLEEKCSTGFCPTFIFIDPFGYKDVPLTLIADLARARNRELFITFMTRNIRSA